MQRASLLSVDSASVMNAPHDFLNCTHCGSPVPAGRDDGFCCAGCSYVHDLLHQQGLDHFYDLKGGAALPPVAPQALRERDYEWLSALQTAADSAGEGDAVELRQVHGDGPHGRRGGWISRGQGTGAGGREGAVAGGMNGIVGRVWVEQPPPLIGGHGSKEPGHPLEKKVLRPPLGSERERQLFPAESAESLNHDDDAAGQTLSGRRLC